MVMFFFFVSEEKLAAISVFVANFVVRYYFRNGFLFMLLSKNLIRLADKILVNYAQPISCNQIK